MRGSERISLRPYREDDRDKVLTLYERVWGRPFRELMESIWAWKYTEVPFPLEDNWRIITERNGQIVGYLGLMPMVFKVGSARLKGCWITDFMVDPEARGQAGLAMAREIIKNRDVPVFGQVGRKYIEYWSRIMGRDVQIAHLTWLRRELCGARALMGFVRAARHGAVALRPGHRRTSVVVEQVSSAEAVRGVLHDLQETHVSIAWRTVDYLSWRFFECPYAAHSMFVARRGADVAGYIVVREDHQELNVVTDILASRDDVPVYRALLETAIDLTLRQGKRAVDALDLRQHGGMALALAQLRFLPPLRHRRECHIIGKVPTHLYPVAYEAENWYITAGDSDIDMRIRP